MDPHAAAISQGEKTRGVLLLFPHRQGQHMGFLLGAAPADGG